MRDGPSSPRRRYVELFVLSAVMLYLELLLIRWVSAEIRIFAYFKNLTLIACFLGMSLGCLVAGRRRFRFVWTYPLVAVLCALVVLPPRLNPEIHNILSAALGDFNEMTIWTWGATEGVSIWTRVGALLGMFVLFVMIVGPFVPLGAALGRMMTACPHKIAAYSANIAGSLAGIWLFSFVAYLVLPPLAWFLSALALGWTLLRGRWQLATGLSCTVLVGALLSWQPVAPNTMWSPYQKLSYRQLELRKTDGTAVPAGFLLQVNQTFYQRAVNLSKRYLATHPDLFPEVSGIDYIAYNLVYRLQPKLDNVLVVGAGTGNDVAAALRNGAQHVDAVEIDPVIAEIGRRIHPERPYDSARVDVMVDDARSFLKKANRKYDLIVFGALDSHTLNSSLSNIRIDNYVYTVESFREARDLLAPGGLVCLVFSIERPFIGDRLTAMLEEAFGRPPVVFHNSEVRLLNGAGGGPTFLIDREGDIERRIHAAGPARALIEAAALKYDGDVPSATDDWPYLYLKDKQIPRLYLIVMTIVIVLAGISLKPLVGGIRRLDPHFFFLGAGFLLIEVQSISKIALLFGTTWIVNSIVISAVLGMILLANLTAAVVRIRSLSSIFVCLGASLLLSYFFPLSVLLPLPPALKALLAGALMSLPIFFAGLIFILTFARIENSAPALGSNLFGAIVGGMFESASFVIGINGLGLIALGFYAGSFIYSLARGKLRA